MTDNEPQVVDAIQYEQLVAMAGRADALQAQCAGYKQQRDDIAKRVNELEVRLQATEQLLREARGEEE